MHEQVTVQELSAEDFAQKWHDARRVLKENPNSLLHLEALAELGEVYNRTLAAWIKFYGTDAGHGDWLRDHLNVNAKAS